MTERVLECLSDGKRHSISKIAKNTGLLVKEAKDIAKELGESGILDYNQNSEEVKLSSWVKKLPPKVTIKRNRVLAAFVIMPPKSTVHIQDATITNSTDIDLELSIRINGNLKEMAIDKFK